MTEVATYQSQNAKPGFEWLAYVVLPNGNYRGVRFNGATEEIARSRAIVLWEKENAKWERLGLNNPEPDDEDETQEIPKSTAPFVAGRGHHFAGKVWMRSAEGKLARVPHSEVAEYEKNGYHRSGPRSK